MRAVSRHCSFVFCIISVCMVNSRALAWGSEGHRITGEIAAAYLSDEARAAVEEILRGQSLAEVSNWADEARGRERYEWTRPLHYVNVPRSATSVNMQRDCANSMCVVGAIRAFADKLRESETPTDERRDALRFLIHFIGDVHQPMHVSYSDDLGGNRIDVALFNDRDTNLHRVWDTGLIRVRMGSGSPRELAEEIKSNITKELHARWSDSIDPVVWANESLTITRRIYAELPRGGVLGQEYYEHNISDVLLRLAMAGVRMAAMLNDIYSPEPDPKAEEAEQRAKSEAQAAMRAVQIIEGEACGPEGGKLMHLLNTHESRLVETRVRRTWEDRGRERSVEEVIVVRPGDGDKRRLGCSHQQVGREVRIFKWEILSARFR